MATSVFVLSLPLLVALGFIWRSWKRFFSPWVPINLTLLHIHPHITSSNMSVATSNISTTDIYFLISALIDWRGRCRFLARLGLQYPPPLGSSSTLTLPASFSSPQAAVSFVFLGLVLGWVLCRALLRRAHCASLTWSAKFLGGHINGGTQLSCTWCSAKTDTPSGRWLIGTFCSSEAISSPLFSILQYRRKYGTT